MNYLLYAFLWSLFAAVALLLSAAPHLINSGAF